MSNVRLAPPLFHNRWYHLNALRDALASESRFAMGGRSGQTLVDLGCGDMPYRMLYQPLVDRYIGVDLSSNARADMHFDGAGKVPLPDGSADVVLSTQVLEHVSSPQQYLAEARRLLRPGGVLFLSTHGYWMFHPDPTDYWRWTGEGLKTEIAKAGFRVERCRGVMNLASAGVQLFQDGLTPRVPSFLRSAFHAGALRTRELTRSSPED